MTPEGVQVGRRLDAGTRTAYADGVVNVGGLLIIVIVAGAMSMTGCHGGLLRLAVVGAGRWSDSLRVALFLRATRRRKDVE